MKVSIESKVSEKARKTIDVLQTQREAEIKLGYEAEQELKAKTPKKTGKTAASWTLSVSGVSWTLTPVGREDIMRYLEFGTAPHIIQASAGSVLAFEVNGETVFATFVHHPGTKPLGIVDGVRQMVEKKAQELTAETLSKIKGVWS